MDTALSIIAGIIILAAAILAVYVTWLFASRIRSGESAPKSFLRWLRDLYDLALGL
jgi:hypothetical protein